MRSRLDERREAHPVPWGPKDVLSGLALAGLGLALAIGGTALALAGGLAVIIAPLAEETFFRGFIFTALHQRWGFLRAAATSGFLFALPHADPGSIIPFTGAGMVLAVAYANSGSLWGSIATHALFNLISFTAAATTGIGGGG